MLLLKSILTDRWFRAAAAAAFVQQLLVATGTFLLGDITTRLPMDGIPWLSCFVMLGCMALSGSIAFYVMNLFSLRAQHSSLHGFLSRYFSKTFQNPLFWRSADERSKRHDMMCREAQDTLQEGNAFLLDVWTTGWNIILNTVSVVLVIGPQSGLVILFAGLTSSLMVHYASERIARNAVSEMDDQNNLNAHLNVSWDNLVLGNALSFGLWKQKFQGLFMSAQVSAEKSLRSRERVLSAGNFITSSAVVGSVLIQAAINQGQLPVVLALFAMLPRTMQINMHVQIIHSYWAGWQRLRERLNLASQCIAEFPRTDSRSLMRASEIQIVGRSLVQEDAGRLASPQTFRVDDVVDRIPSLQSGRITVRGENGAGKSVLLSLIKERLGVRAFYLPAQHQLEIPGVVVSQSHGERALAALDAVSQQDPSLEVLLLDEWDANLSAENRDMMSAKIETLSANKLVIEVRHNQEGLALVPSYA